MTEPVVDAAIEVVAGLVEELRSLGVVVPVDSTIAFAAALAHLDLGWPTSLYWAGRLTLIHRRDDLPLFDQAVRAFVGQGAPKGTAAPPPVRPVGGAPAAMVPCDDGARGQREERGDAADRASVAASVMERLGRRDFAACTPEEWAELERAIDALAWPAGRRSSHRSGAEGRAARRIDLARTAGAARRTGGEVVRFHHRRRRDRPRRVVLMIDVSGSMEPYARALLRFGHAAVVGRGHVEVFALGTRLTRLTRSLTLRDPDAALAAAAASVPDWSGGTRLGDAVAEFVERWGGPGLARGATVVILSDGWERGDPALLANGIERLSLLTRRLIWANPLRASPGFEPLARGMAAALPFCDEFVDGHSLNSLDHLAQLIGPAGTHRPHLSLSQP